MGWKVSNLQEHDQKSGQNLWVQSRFSVQLGALLKKGSHVVSFWLRVSPGIAVSPEVFVPSGKLDDRKKRVSCSRGLS